jgi:hypothetical protein
MRTKTFSKKNTVITEAQLRRIIYDELIEQYMIQEGLWDDVKSGAKKLVSTVTKPFKKVAASWAKKISEYIEKLSDMPEDAKVMLQALKKGMQETGESFKMTAELLEAKKFSAVAANAPDLLEQDFKDGVHDKMKSLGGNKKNESVFIQSVSEILNESKYVSTKTKQERLNEDFGIISGIGVGLALLGGIPMLFKGLHKLASVLGAHRTAELFGKAEKIAHHFERDVIDLVIPDKLSYFIYKHLKTNFKHFSTLSKKKMLTLEEFQLNSDHSGAMRKIQTGIFKTVLIAFAMAGFVGALKAGASLLGAVEGGATTVKGVELAQGAKELASLMRSGAAAASGTAGVADMGMDV